MNKETLEEAAENYAKQFDYAEDSSPQLDFIEGAKWEREHKDDFAIGFAKWMYDFKGDINKVEELLKIYKKEIRNEKRMASYAGRKSLDKSI